MNILLVSGYAPNKNSSANLSHNAFIEGFIKLGYKVDIICHNFDVNNEKKEIPVPEFHKIYTYDGLSLYEKLASKKRANAPANYEAISQEAIDESAESIKTRVVKAIKKFLWNMYGAYNPSVVWYYRAKKFKSNTPYDYVISMGYPHISHRVAGYLLNHNRIQAKKWIQLWEDPWYYSLELHGKNQRVKRAEYKVLDAGQDIVYVSPITLKNQQRIFDRDKDKMRWCPLAAYYTEHETTQSHTGNHYGYFGDYFPYARNLVPFYNVAEEKGLKVDICGRPTDLLKSTDKIKIFPRLPIDELKKHEDLANVVICLFNLGGGQIPGKIYQLAATNKTILAILDGPEDEQKIIRDYFEKFNRFVFCQNNEQSISEAIDRIENNDLGGVSNKPINDFSVEKVAKMLLGDL